MSFSTAETAEPGRFSAGPPDAQRLLFVSSTTGGGSGRSQRELAASLAAAGRDVRFLVDHGGSARVRRQILEEFTDASTRFEGKTSGRLVELVRRRIGRATRTQLIDALPHQGTIAPENAFEALVRRWRPDVVVASSISRVTWRRVRSVCRCRGLPAVLYLREATAIGHLTAGLFPDVLLANSASLVDGAARVGVEAELLPSLVEVRAMREPPTGEVALLVNPKPTHGVDVVGPLAAALPHIPIVLQESWSLNQEEQAEVDRIVRSHPNVSFRPYDPRPDTLFRDVGVLLAPHRLDNRPRTVLEAQANGIPVIATDQPGLVEAVGDGGRLIPRDAGPEEWIRTLGEFWDDPDARMTLSERARMHAARPEVRPASIAARFAQVVDGLVAEGSW